jgi:phosphohistidine phosphatase
MKSVILLRHAEALSQADDFERVLSTEGEAAASRVGKTLRQRGVQLDRIIASAAVRARTTAELVARELGAAVPIVFDEALYEAAPSQYLRVLSNLPASLRCVLLVGHNPSLSDLARTLLGRGVALAPADHVTISREVDDWHSFN